MTREEDRARRLAERLIRACVAWDKDQAERLRGQLAELGSVAVPVLVPLVEHADELVRLYAMDALQDIGDPSSIPALERALHDPHGDVRIEAAETLTRLQPQKAGRSVARLLRSDDVYDRANALWNLGRLKDLSLLPEITRLQESDPDAALRRIARVVAIQISEGVPGLVRLLADPDADVRYCAIEALGAEKDPAAAPALLDTLFHDPIGRVRSHAGGYLRDILDESDATALERALNDPEPLVRQTVLGSIAALTGERALPLLDRIALHDPDEQVRKGARYVMRLVRTGKMPRWTATGPSPR